MNKIRNKFRKKENGQSLVEMAVIAPILIFMLIGLFEVGYAMWGYMTLLNIDREATRFASISGALDYSIPDPANVGLEIGYSDVITHALLSNADQLKLTDYIENNTNNLPGKPKAAIILTHIVADTRKPCDNSVGNGPNTCFEGDSNADGFCDGDDYTTDDLILHPEVAGYEHFKYVYPVGQTYFTSTLTGQALTDKANELKTANDCLNRRLWNKIDNEDFNDFSRNAVIIAEMFYEQPQLLGFPLFSWIANPLPLRVETTMRVDSDDQAKCSLFPIAAHEDTINDMKTMGAQNLIEGPPAISRPPGANNSGWVAWNPDGSTSATYLEEEFRNPNLATTDFVDALDPSDTVLNIGDWLSSLTGVTNSDAIRNSLAGLVGQNILIPVYNQVGGAGANGRYLIVGFAEVRVQSFNLPPGNNGGNIMATFVEYPVTWACPGNGF